MNMSQLFGFWDFLQVLEDLQYGRGAVLNGWREAGAADEWFFFSRQGWFFAKRTSGWLD